MTDKTPKPATVARPINPQSSDEDFDDVLFSSSEEVAPAGRSEAAETFHFEDAFDDVLFGEDAAAEDVSPVAPAAVSSVAVDESGGDFSDEDLYFVEDEKISTPAVPTAKVPVASSVPTLKSTPVPVRKTGSNNSADIPVLGAVEDALFASDDALDAALDRVPSQVQAKGRVEVEVEVEVYGDALFDSDEALEKSLDDESSSNSVAKPGSHVAQEDDYSDALFDSDDAMIAASDNPEPQQKAVQSKPQPSIIEKPVRVFDYQVLLSDLSKSPELTLNSSAPIAPRLLNRAINGVRSLSLFEEREVDEAAYAEFKRQRLAAKEAENAVAVPANVKDKAKLLFSKARGNVDEILGASLPVREMPLDFKFTLQRPKKDIEGLMGRREIAQLLEKKGATVHNLMRRMDKQLLLLSRSEQSDADRLQILQLLSPCIVEHSLALHKRFCKNPLQPSDAEYYSTALLCVEVLKNAITGYRQLFAAIYESNNFNYTRQRDAFIEIAFHLLELLLLEQRFLAVIQYAPSNISIRSVNKVFAAISLYESEQLQLRFDSIFGSQKQSFTDSYIRYQLMLCFDHCALNPRFSQVLLDYLDEHGDFVSVLDPQELQYATSCQFLHVTDAIENRAAYCTELVAANAEVEPHWTAYLSVLDFFNRIKNDFKQCYSLLNGERKEHSDAVIKPLALPAILSVCSFTNNSVLQLQENQKVPQYRLYSPVAIELRSGFVTCRESIAESHAVAVDSPVKSNKPVLPRVGLWSVSFRSEHSIYLQAEISSKLPSLLVGDLLLLREDIDGELQQQLVRLVRVECAVNNLLSVIVCPVASEAAEVSLATDIAAQAIIALQADTHLLLRTAEAKPYSDEVLHAQFADEAKHFLRLDQLQFMNEYYQQFSLS